MRAQAGFTLVEAMVSGVLSAMVAMVIFTVFRMNSNQIRQSSAQLQLAQIYDALSGDIHRASYAAASARPLNCAGTGIGSNCGVLFYDGAGVFMRGFRVRRKAGEANIGVVEEATTPALLWQAYQVASNVVEVSLNVDDFFPKITGLFNVYDDTPPFDDRVQGVRFNLRLNMPVSGTRATLPMQTESNICRNAVEWNVF